MPLAPGCDGRMAPHGRPLVTRCARHGDRRRAWAAERLAESVGAIELALTSDDLSAIEVAIPAGAAAGERYNPSGMASLDSERDRAATSMP